ncbi:LOW QUALITY PROTEIN: biogenesis of lysosome-related organelles complex 1 subunit 3-like [Morphnus guianensis]
MRFSPHGNARPAMLCEGTSGERLGISRDAALARTARHVTCGGAGKEVGDLPVGGGGVGGPGGCLGELGVPVGLGGSEHRVGEGVDILQDPGAKAGAPPPQVGAAGGGAAPLPPLPRVVPGKASESDSEPELLGGAAGVPGAGLKVPGEASETEEEEEEERGGQRPKPPPAMAEETAAIWGGPSLLQQRLGEGSGLLQGTVGSALRQSYSTATWPLGGALGRTQATAATHCLRLARRDLCAVAATVDIVTACRLLPKVRRELPAL